MKPWIITDFRPECYNPARARTRQLVRVSEGDSDGSEISLSTQEMLTLLNSIPSDILAATTFAGLVLYSVASGRIAETQSLTLSNHPRRCQVCNSTDVEVADYCG